MKLDPVNLKQRFSRKVALSAVRTANHRHIPDDKKLGLLPLLL
jgi:hypothetical protein